MKIETYRCDVCGAEKRETNHWWTIQIRRNAEDGFRLLNIQPALAHSSPLSEARAAGTFDVYDLCGESCVQRKVAEFLGALSGIGE